MSSINPNNIDGTYPIAGQDNDSQGFRDNFTNIKNNLTFAKTEIEDLQVKGIFKTALNGTTLDNELNDTIISGAQLVKVRETINELPALSGTVTVDWADAHFQTLVTGGSITLALTGWPTSGRHAKMRLQIDVTNVAHTLTLPAAVTVNQTNIQGESGSVITFPATGIYLFEFGTYNGGIDIYIRDLLRNYDNISPSSSFSTITVSTLANITANTAATTTTTGALKVAGGVGIVGNIVAGNVNTSAVTATNLAGSLTTAAQGNITSVGNLTSLSSSGTIQTTGNILANNISASGTISSSKVEDTRDSAYVSSKSLTIAPGGDNLLYYSINSNLSVGYNAGITAGSQVTMFVKNGTGGNLYVQLPNANNNKAVANVAVGTNVHAMFIFTAFGTNAANVAVTAITN